MEKFDLGIHYENVKQVSTVGELKQLLSNYPDDTELVGIGNKRWRVNTELYVGETHPVGDRDYEDEIILAFTGNHDKA